MSIISSLLIAAAIAFTFLALLVLLIWSRGDGDAVLLPGFGLVVSTPALTVLLLILSIIFVIAAAITKPNKKLSERIVASQNFEKSGDNFNK